MEAIHVTFRVVPNDAENYINRTIDALQQELAYRIVDEGQAIMETGNRTGILYRRGTFGRGVSRGTGRRGFTGAGRGIHRASRAGEALAVDTGETLRSIKFTRISQGKYRVRFGGWAGYWEFDVDAARRRYVIMPAIERAVEKTFHGTIER